MVIAFGPQELGKSYVGITQHCYILNIQAVGLMVLASLWTLMAQGVANWTSGAWLAGLMLGTTRHCFI